MTTKLLYLENAYLKKHRTKIVDVIDVSDNLYDLILEETIFYPRESENIGDRGQLTSKKYECQIIEAYKKDEIYHRVNSQTKPIVGDEIIIQLDWDRRYKSMQTYTIGCLIDFAITKIYKGEDITLQKEEYGKSSTLYFENAKELSEDKILRELSRMIKSENYIKWEFINLEKAKEIINKIPPRLLDAKKVRVVSIEGYGSMINHRPLLATTSELNEININLDISRQKDDNLTLCTYQLNMKESAHLKPEQLQEELENVEKEVKEKLTNATAPYVEQVKINYLGRKSPLTNILRNIKNLEPSQRKQIGQLANQIKGEIDELINERLDRIKKEMYDKEKKRWIDVTEPTKPIKEGSIHPITQMKWKMGDIFQKMGFEIVTPYELDDDYHTFTSLNIPQNHPARDMWDTFWTEDNHIPITHTSAMQNRILKSKTPPIRAIVPGRCFRHEATDASHEFQFHQVEGVYVDKGITFADMIGTLQEFMRNFFDKDVEMATSVFSKSKDKIETRIQPSFFPFVEPAIEIMIKWKVGDSYKWLEVIPCGPIHPAVLKEGGLDPDVYSGFAWGFGFERLIMIKYGIEDIRNFHSGDLRFLTQF